MLKTSYEKANIFLDNSVSQKQLGMKIDPTADIHPNVLMEGTITVGKFVQIDAGVIMRGKITIGDYSVIHNNTSLRGTIIIGKNVNIFEHVNVEGGRPGKFAGSCTNYIEDHAVIADSCMIGAGTVMHGTQLGRGTVIGCRCACDYNTVIGTGVLMTNGSATAVDSIYGDNCQIEGVTGNVVKYGITISDIDAYLGYDYTKMMSELEARLRFRSEQDIRLTDRAKGTNLKIDDTAYVHPTAILEGNIEIGAYSEVGAGSIIIGDVKIGSHVWMTLNNIIKGGVVIGDSTHLYDNTLIDGVGGPSVDIPILGVKNPLKIGSKCWINHGCIVRGRLDDMAVVHISAATDYNTHLMEGAILGGTSTLRPGEIVPPYSLAEGIPAKVRYSNITLEDRMVYLGIDTMGFSKQIDKRLEDLSKDRTVVNNFELDSTSWVHPKVWLEGHIKLGKYAYVDAGSILTGDVEIGDHTLIRLNCSLRGTMKIGKYTFIYDQVNIEGGRGKGIFDAGNATGSGEDTGCIGDYCWVNHGAVMHGTQMGDCSAINIGGACDYNTRLGTGAVVANRSFTHLDQYVPTNTLAVGSPSDEVKKFLTDDDRYGYFGLLPRLWALAEAEWLEAEINKKMDIK